MFVEPKCQICYIEVSFDLPHGSHHSRDVPKLGSGFVVSAKCVVLLRILYDSNVIKAIKITGKFLRSLLSTYLLNYVVSLARETVLNCRGVKM